MNMPDNDLAVEELAAIDVEGGMSRSAFILRGAMTAGAVYGTTMVAPFVSQALAQSGGGDVAILNFALTLEYLETAFYRGARTRLGGSLSGLAKKFGDEEAQHVDAITATIKKLGGKPVAKPKFSFPAITDANFLKLAVALEDTGVGAYNGAAPSIKTPAVLAAAGSIVQIEARHAAIVRGRAGQAPAPLAFDRALTKKQVLAAAGPFLKG
jgi:rubrerythrin